MRVAIFTDNDFDKVNGVTTTLKAVLKYADDRARPRVLTAGDERVDTPEYFAASSIGMGLPWYRDMRVYLPRLRQFARELRRQRADVIHITTPGPVGLAGRWLAGELGLPMVGSYHTHLGEYVRTLGGSRRVGDGMDTYMRWFYGTCTTVLVPSRATERLLVSQGHGAHRLRIWPRGVDIEQFSPVRASQELRRQWRVDSRRPAILYAGRLSAEKGLKHLPRIRQLLHRRAVEHQMVFAGDGPMAAALKREIPDGVFLGALPHHEVARVMASADVFLFPSPTDSFGNVVLEAQAGRASRFSTTKAGSSARPMTPKHSSRWLCRSCATRSAAARWPVWPADGPNNTDGGRRSIRSLAHGATPSSHARPPEARWCFGRKP
jgi:glycosyltransferase involved in cell wall biosynthesis